MREYDLQDQIIQPQPTLIIEVQELRSGGRNVISIHNVPVSREYCTDLVSVSHQHNRTPLAKPLTKLSSTVFAPLIERLYVNDFTTLTFQDAWLVYSQVLNSNLVKLSLAVVYSSAVHEG